MEEKPNLMTYANYHHQIDHVAIHTNPWDIQSEQDLV